MSQLVGNTGAPQRILNSQVQVGAKGKADIISALGGRARWLAEFTTGTVNAGNSGCAPNTGAGGGVGHDHSGGSLGRPITHTFGLWVFGYHDMANLSPSDPTALQTQVTSGAPSASNIGTPRLLYNGPIKTVEVPPCGPGGVYITSDMIVGVHSSVISTITVEVINAKASPYPITFSQALVANTRTFMRAATNATPRMIPLVPGVVNRLDIRITAAYSAANAVVSLLCMSLLQTKTTP